MSTEPPEAPEVRPPELDESLAPPPDSVCGVHIERAAVIRCPRCTRLACFSCWQPVQRRCHTCVMSYPAEVAPLIPWETEGVGFFAGLGGTLKQSFSPTRTAPALAGGDVRHALGFALLTWLPLAALQGVIPYTHTLLFEPWSVTVRHGASDAAIGADVARAMSLGVLLGGLQLLAIGMAFASLTKAFGMQGVASSGAAWRTVLYRGFIVMLLPSLMAGGTVGTDLLVGLMVLVGFPPVSVYGLIVVVAGVWLLTTLRTSARLAQGVGPGMSFLIPFMVLAFGVLVRLIAETACQPFMPVAEVPAETAPRAPQAPLEPDAGVTDGGLDVGLDLGLDDGGA